MQNKVVSNRVEITNQSLFTTPGARTLHSKQLQGLSQPQNVPKQIPNQNSSVTMNMSKSAFNEQNKVPERQNFQVPTQTELNYKIMDSGNQRLSNVYRSNPLTQLNSHFRGQKAPQMSIASGGYQPRQNTVQNIMFQNRMMNQKCAANNRSRAPLTVMNAVPENATEQETKVVDTQDVGFYRNKDGYLMCDKLSVRDVFDRATYKPFYLMSKSQLRSNFEAYQTALEGLDLSFIGYAVKANHNMHVLRYLASLGSGAVLVSGNELRTAIKAGFDTNKMVFNGNGKMLHELEFAVENDVLVNIDSEFDLDHIIQASKNVGKKARTMLRINPDVDPKVHPYVSTGMASSKFGIDNKHIDYYLKTIKENADHVVLQGVHCHIGSTIKDVGIFRDAALVMVDFVKMIRNEGFELQYLNIGGGLGIDYERNGAKIPTPQDLIDTVRDLIQKMDLKLIIEPGRSMVGNTTIFVNTVIGTKSNGTKNFIVTDGSMSELIRPSLYDTYQHIEIAEPAGTPPPFKKYDIVGPVCESADFLGKDRELPEPKEGQVLVVYDAGAYCQAMSSNYNMKLTCAEYWVDGDELYQIRKDPDLDEYLSVFDNVPKQIKN